MTSFFRIICTVLLPFTVAIPICFGEWSEDGCFYKITSVFENPIFGPVPSSDYADPIANEGLINPEKPFFGFKYPIIKEEKLTQLQYKGLVKHPAVNTHVNRLVGNLRKDLRDRLSLEYSGELDDPGAVNPMVFAINQKVTLNTGTTYDGGGTQTGEAPASVTFEAIQSVKAEILVRFCQIETFEPLRNIPRIMCMKPMDVGTDVAPCEIEDGWICPVSVDPPTADLLEPPAPLPLVIPVPRRVPKFSDGTVRTPPTAEQKTSTLNKINAIKNTMNTVANRFQSFEYKFVTGESFQGLLELVKILNDYPYMKVTIMGYTAGKANLYQEKFNTPPTALDLDVLNKARVPLNHCKTMGDWYQALALARATKIREKMRELGLKRREQVDVRGARPGAKTKTTGNAEMLTEIQYELMAE